MKNKASSIIYRLIGFCSPFLFLIGCYCVLDPFHIIYTIDSGTNLHYSRDVCSSRLFIKNYPTYKFDSYVFGSSRSMAFTLKDWAPIIHDDKTYHFDASEESIFGVYTKIKYIDKIGGNIKNALIISDASLFNETTDAPEFLYCKDYKIAHTSPFVFHLIFFKTFFTDLFFVKYIDYYIFHIHRPYMYGIIPSGKQTDYFDSIHNEGTFYPLISVIKTDSASVYANKKMFYTRPENPSVDSPVIKQECMKMLLEIKRIFDKDHTSYKIVISPLYDQKKFSPIDLTVLKELFGSQNVYDFSGKNSFTSSKTNYYDQYHYKIPIARQILSQIYSGY